ncbi:MAG TPA: formate dehydrogenase accessory sulfurtransferase FdhD [Verrucomicrobiae bacterium]|nr:formate dehydrogenase accessory sulfurtransferase FdhD [Verrucomicrobiae bacterium]
MSRVAPHLSERTPGRRPAGRAGTSRLVVRRWAGGLSRSDHDWVAAEEPLQVALNGNPLAILMRTPGADLELVLGLLHAEGVVSTAGDVARVRLSPSGQEDVDPELLGAAGIELELLPEVEGLVDVELRRPLADGQIGWQRALPSSSACGVCGATTLAAIQRTQPQVVGTATWPVAVLHILPDRLRETQTGFDRTGGLHAAALVAPGGTLLAVHEDIGRHNAVDKLIGLSLLRSELPLGDRLLLVSGRAGFEIVQKAAAAGIPVIASVSAPSSLAVRVAEQVGATLVGFLRDGRCNVYTHPERVVAGAVS